MKKKNKTIYTHVSDGDILDKESIIEFMENNPEFQARVTQIDFMSNDTQKLTIHLIYKIK